MFFGPKKRSRLAVDPSHVSNPSESQPGERESASVVGLAAIGPEGDARVERVAGGRQKRPP